MTWPRPIIRCPLTILNGTKLCATDCVGLHRGSSERIARFCNPHSNVPAWATESILACLTFGFGAPTGGGARLPPVTAGGALLELVPPVSIHPVNPVNAKARINCENVMSPLSGITGILPSLQHHWQASRPRIGCVGEMTPPRHRVGAASLRLSWLSRCFHFAAHFASHRSIEIRCTLRTSICPFRVRRVAGCFIGINADDHRFTITCLHPHGISSAHCLRVRLETH
jgi:hypothetical protein